MKRNRYFFPLVLALAFGSPSIAFAQAPLPKGVSAGPSIEGISQYNLPNGMKVLLFPDSINPMRQQTGRAQAIFGRTRASASQTWSSEPLYSPHGKMAHGGPIPKCLAGSPPCPPRCTLPVPR